MPNLKLIDDFKKEHLLISSILGEVKRLGVHTMEGRNELSEAKDVFLAHFKEKNKRLYPALKRRSNKNQALKQMVGLFEKEMKDTSNLCSEFFDKYSINGGGIDFFRDFDKLYNAIQARGDKEENDLYPRYK